MPAFYTIAVLDHDIVGMLEALNATLFDCIIGNGTTQRTT